ncbi:MAG: transposase [Saprospiraceae bacterium]|nr:transposase [Saprospiraceae bacterium]
MPPRLDITRQSEHNSNTVKTRKNVGGQPDHKGNYLKARTHVDDTMHHKPEICTQCGYDLRGEPVVEIRRGQVIDIPQIKMSVREHVNYAIQCPSCNKDNKQDLPGMQDYCLAQYGQNIKDFIVFMNARQYLPIARTNEMVSAMTGESISTGSIAICIHHQVQESSKYYEKIIEAIKSEVCVHADETSMKVKA